MFCIHRVLWRIVLGLLLFCMVFSVSLFKVMLQSFIYKQLKGREQSSERASDCGRLLLAPPSDCLSDWLFVKLMP